jgi:hypothetical protein
MTLANPGPHADRFWGTTEVVKINKRLHIRVLETGRLLYSPPDFVIINGRDSLWHLATQFTHLQWRNIECIAHFEIATRRVGEQPCADGELPVHYQSAWRSSRASQPDHRLKDR